MSNGSNILDISQLRQQFSPGSQGHHGHHERLGFPQATCPQISELGDVSDKYLHLLELVASHIRITGEKATPQIIHNKLPASSKPKNEASTSESLRQLSQHNTKGLSVPLLYRDKTGSYGAFEYALADGLNLEKILSEKERRGLQLLTVGMGQEAPPPVSSSESTEIESDDAEYQVDYWHSNSSTDDRQQNGHHESHLVPELGSGTQMGDGIPPRRREPPATCPPKATVAEEMQVEEDTSREANLEDSAESNYLLNEMAALRTVLARLVQEIKQLNCETAELKIDNQMLRQELQQNQQKLSALEGKIYQASNSTSVEALLNDILSPKATSNGTKNGTKT